MREHSGSISDGYVMPALADSNFNQDQSHWPHLQGYDCDHDKVVQLFHKKKSTKWPHRPVPTFSTPLPFINHRWSQPFLAQTQAFRNEVMWNTIHSICDKPLPHKT